MYLCICVCMYIYMYEWMNLTTIYLHISINLSIYLFIFIFLYLFFLYLSIYFSIILYLSVRLLIYFPLSLLCELTQFCLFLFSLWHFLSLPEFHFPHLIYVQTHRARLSKQTYLKANQNGCLLHIT